MTSSLKNKLDQLLKQNWTTFQLTTYMYEKGEFNCLKRIKELVEKNGIVDFTLIQPGLKIEREAELFDGNTFQGETIKFRSPPKALQYRMWITNFKKYVNPLEDILLTVLNEKIHIMLLTHFDAHAEKILTELSQNQEVKVLKNQEESTSDRRRGTKKDYVEEARINAEIGLAGEKYVMQNLKKELSKQGYSESHIDSMLEHSSVEIGDGLGYDIRLKISDQSIKYIEVKTTTGDLETPFFMSKSELEFYRNNKEEYYLCRVYSFDMNDKTGHTAIIKTDLESIIEFEQTTYRCKFKKGWRD